MGVDGEGTSTRAAWVHCVCVCAEHGRGSGTNALCNPAGFCHTCATNSQHGITKRPQSNLQVRKLRTILFDCQAGVGLYVYVGLE